MKRMLLAGSLVLNSVTGSKLTFGSKGGEGSLSLAIGSPVSVEMETNPTTGYDWHLVGSLPDCLAASEPRYRTIKSPEGKVLIGAPSIKEFELTATGVCQADLRFEYVRPWEKKDDSARYIIIHVSVVGDELL